MNNRSKARELLAPRIAVDDALKDTRAFLEGSVVVVPGEGQRVWNVADAWSSERPRAFGRKAHGWFFVHSWLAGYAKLGKDDRVRFIMQVSTALETWRTSVNEPDSMAFHDETTAQRLMNLLLLEEALGDELQSASSAADLLRAVADEDVRRLGDPHFYAGVNNHGMFQNIALLMAAAYGYEYASADIEKIAFERLGEYFSVAFTPEGVHIDNNPTYHMMVASYLKKVEDYAEHIGNRTFSNSFRIVLSKADLFAAHMLTPMRRFPPISDSAVSVVTPSRAQDVFGAGYMLGATTGGNEGWLPRARAYVAERSGYASVRESWTDSNAAFLCFTSAYNSDYHKHSDEMSVYFSDGDVEVLREAGPNGYEYSDPYTQYAYSSFAHNSLVVDGKGLPRIDSNASATSMRVCNTNEDEIDVVGKTERYNGVDWERRLISTVNSRERGFIAEDNVRSNVEHKYSFFWHFGHDVDVSMGRNSVILRRESSGSVIGVLSWESRSPNASSVVTGRTSPSIQGWMFPRMGTKRPASCLIVDVKGRNVSVRWEMRTRNLTPKDLVNLAKQGEKEAVLADSVKDVMDVGLLPRLPARVRPQGLLLWGVNRHSLLLGYVAVKGYQGNVAVVDPSLNAGRRTKLGKLDVVSLVDSPAGWDVAVSNAFVGEVPPGKFSTYSLDHGTADILARELHRNSAIELFRISKELNELGAEEEAGFVHHAIYYIYNCRIPVTATIGADSTLAHGGIGVVIHKDATVGERVKIGQNVTLGARAGGNGAPRIGDDVFIGPNSVCLGGAIGDEGIVRAGSVVIDEVGKQQIVAGVPSRVVGRND